MNSDAEQKESSAQSYLNQGSALARQGQIAQALPLFQKAVTLNPELTKAHYCLALAYRDTDQRQKSIDIATNGLKDTEDDFDLLVLIADNQRIMKLTEAAIASLKKAEKINPNHPLLLLNLAVLYFDNGDKPKVLDYATRALNVAPNLTHAHFMISKSRTYKNKNDQHIHDITNLLQNTQDTPPREKADLYFSLGKIYDDLKEYDTAFDNYTRGNKEVRSTYEFSITNLVRNFKAFRQPFNSELLQKHEKNSLQSDAPIFVVGMPRSGTSLVEQILASHSHVYGAGEKSDIERIIGRTLGLTPQNIGDKIHNLTADDLHEAANEYLTTINHHLKGHSHVVDKMPMNFCFIGLIKLLFPKAKIIHCVRSPKDTCVSIFRTHFGGFVPFAYDLKEITQYHKLYQDQMTYWKALFTDEIYDIEYEALINDQKQQTKQLLSYCGLDWEDACLDFHKTKRSVFTASSYQVTQPIYKDAQGSWQRYQDNLPDYFVAL